MDFYFHIGDNEVCYSESHFQDEMEFSGDSEIQVHKAKRMTISESSGFFWCKAVEVMGEKGECGKTCKDYAPRNGKSGCCKEYGNLYEKGELITIKRKDGFR